METLVQENKEKDKLIEQLQTEISVIKTEMKHLRAEKIESEKKLSEQIKELIDDNCELNGNIGVTEMLFDSFKEEMLELYGHVSEKSSYWKETSGDEADGGEEQKMIECGDCDFRAKSKNGLKIHISRIHKKKNISCP